MFRKILSAFVAVICAGAVAWAVPPGNRSVGSIWAAVKTWAGAPIYVTDYPYGAACDGVTDDAAAFNAASQALRTAGAGEIALPSGRSCLVKSSWNLTGLVGVNRPIVISGHGARIIGQFATKGPVGTFGTIAGGTGYANGTYANVPLTGGSGSACTAANVVVSGGAVASVTLSGPCGSGYLPGDALSASAAALGGTGSGFSVHVATIGGAAVVDLVGSRYVKVRDLVVNCSATTSPNIGIQSGRTASYLTANADNLLFSGVTVNGNCALAAELNANSESSKWLKTALSNNIGYALIEDGYNHFNLYSPFVSVTMPVDTPDSLTGNSFDNAIFNSNAVNPIWIGNAGQLKFTTSYVLYNGPGGDCVTLYGATNYAGSNQDYDLHCEGANLQDIFFITGPYATPNYKSFTYSDHVTFASRSIFHADANVTGVALFDLRMRLDINGHALTSIFYPAGQFQNGNAGEIYLGASFPPPNNAFSGFFWQDNYQTNTDGPIYFNGPVGALSSFSIAKQASAYTAAANKCALTVMAGTTGGTCKLVAVCGTSSTPTTIVDNVGGGC